MKVASGHVVAIEYQVRLDDGELIEETPKGAPVQYLHGKGILLPALEVALQGREEGSSGTFVLLPSAAYGERDESNVIALPRAALPSEINLVAGMRLAARSNGGEPFPVTIVEVHGDRVMVDLNHPLAGKRLHFSVVIRSVRPAADEEVFYGSPRPIEVV